MKKILIVTIAAIAAFTIFYTGIAYGQKTNTYSLLRIFNRVLTIIQDNYVETVEDEELIRGAIHGMVDTLNDPHTSYLSKNEYQSLRISTEGEFGGIGAQLGMRNNKPIIIAPMDNAPAKRAGLMPGDVIMKVDGEDMEGKRLDEVVRRIRGNPGTKVSLFIERAAFPEPAEFVITRSTIRIDAIPYAGKIRDEIGYIRLADFSRTAGIELQGAIDSLFGLGIKKLILDLRHNSGGLLNEGVEVSECFIEKDKDIVSTRGRTPESVRKFKSSRLSKYGDFPLIVLVDSSSASASEIVAGAIQDWDRGLIIGTHTFGKGSVQNIFPMDDGGAFKATTARWYTPSGRCIDKPRDSVLASELAKETFTTIGPLHRKVYGAGGIAPDSIIGRRVYSWLELEILRRGFYFDFAVKYTNKHKEIPKNFNVTASMLQEFKAFLVDKELVFAESQFDSSKSTLSQAVEQEIASILWGTKTGEAVRVKYDHYVAIAEEILAKNKSTKDLFRLNK